VGLADLLVHLDHFAHSAARLEVAVGLAKRHQARLTGLLVRRHHYPDEATVSATRAMFEQKAAEAGIEGLWQCVEAPGAVVDMTAIINAHAHSCDLLVVGQGTSESAGASVPGDLAESLVLVSGLPVLVVPYAGSFASVGERVLVAWKAGRESTRALNDALPILQRARRVEIMTVYGPESGVGVIERLSADLCNHLARHGVKAAASSLPAGEAALGDVFLNRVSDEGCDLLVMGVYAHGKGGSLEVGPVARQLLREMTVPVLMSH